MNFVQLAIKASSSKSQDDLNFSIAVLVVLKNIIAPSVGNWMPVYKPKTINLNYTEAKRA
jgi:hypothetical protein